MNSARVQEIFGDAMEIADAAERRAMLDAACSGDADLRARVEELLGTHGLAEDFFKRCSATVTASRDTLNLPMPRERAAVEEDFIGTTIGPYKLLQVLGEGGCGAVYMAEQEVPVRRRVALKIIKLGMDTRSVIARFRAEQQALALMDHPNIARVLDAGATAAGRPYFVMELVSGIKVTTYCDEQALDARQRLRLFIQVCHAIQHAHQKGIIHRDIKPSNILVTSHDGVAMPMVIDFGIAKAIEGRLPGETYFTPCEQFVGTPVYMSPEQAELSRLDVDTRSDIYSLGVLLYELLTGRTPFDTGKLMDAGLDEMRRTLREREPLRPSLAVGALQPDDLRRVAQSRHTEPARFASLLRGDLDWIVMKALDKDRNRRYQTANALALDVQRFLDNEPILARPPSRLYRFRKTVSRNRVLFGAAALATAALVGSSAISTWLYLREREARRMAVTAEQQKSTLQHEAEQLRRASADGEKLSQAAELCRRGHLAESDKLVDEIRFPKIALEYAPVYRVLGDWHVGRNEWRQAIERFAVLCQINETDQSGASSDDMRYAVALVSQGDLAGYERFRESLISRSAGTDDPALSQRIIRECLLTPARPELLRALQGFAVVAQKPLRAKKASTASYITAFCAYSQALLAYRSGDYEGAKGWCAQAKTYQHGIQSWDAGFDLVEAMANSRLGNREEAEKGLQRASKVVQEHYRKDAANPGSWQGFWFDWGCARIYLIEAERVMTAGEEPGD
jgi:serine/threonine protein kinase